MKNYLIKVFYLPAYILQFFIANVIYFLYLLVKYIDLSIPYYSYSKAIKDNMNSLSSTIISRIISIFIWGFILDKVIRLWLN